MNPLLDLDFLKELDLATNKEKFAKIISLTFDEYPIEEISGKITQGSINIDGTSAVRRTCSLTMVAEDINLRDFYCGLNTKIKIYVGLKNEINSNYPDIIWFPQGVYIVTAFNTSFQTSGFTISVSGKDKMCLLNGDIGGSINALSEDFGTLEEIDENDITTYTDIPIKNIIPELVHEYAREPYSNIIVNDLDDYGLELMEYDGDSPIYLLYNLTTEEFDNVIIDDEQTYFYESGGNYIPIAIKDIEDNQFYPMMELDTTIEDNTQATLTVYAGKRLDPDTANTDTPYYISRIQNKDTVGYRITDLTYAGDLIATVGEAATATLDKIVKQLGEFEYFYDLDGRFVFQRKRTYVQNTWNNIVSSYVDGIEQQYVDSAATTSACTYVFDSGNLITAYQNNPTLSNLRNDFSIWGQRKTTSDTEVPVHLRYAIEHKPTKYYSINVSQEESDAYNKKYSANSSMQISCFYTTEENPEDSDVVREYTPIDIEEENYKKGVFYFCKNDKFYLSNSSTFDSETQYYYLSKCYKCDWREILYQMASDNLHWGHLDNFTSKIREVNYEIFPYGTTGYAQYYTDMVSFWRDLYNPYIDEVTEPNMETTYYVWNPFTEDYIELKTEEVVGKKLPYEIVDLTKGSTLGDNYYRLNIDSDGKITLVHDAEVLDGNVYCYEQQYYTYDEDTKNYDELDQFASFSDSETYYIKDSNDDFKEYDIYYFLRDIVDETDEKYLKYYKPTAEITLAKSYCSLVKTYASLAINYYKDYRDIYTNLLKYYSSFEVPVSTDAYYYRKKNFKEKLRLLLNEYVYRMGGKELKSADSTSTETKEYEAVYIKAQNYIITNENDITETYPEDGSPIPYFNNCNFSQDNYWTLNLEYPETLNFWIDFLDNTGELDQFGVYAVGDRPKAVNDNDVKAIYFRDTPKIIFVNADEWDGDKKSSYTYAMLPEYLENYFVVSAQGKSAKDVLDEYLYNYSYCIESVTLTTIPIYYLQPNTRIYINDATSGIEGQYIMTKISVPLTYNGTMSITATRAAESIL